MNIQREEDLNLCDKFFTTCFKNHKLDCNDVGCLCSKSNPSFNNFYFKDMLISMVDKKIEEHELNSQIVAAFIAVLLKREK